MSDKRSSSVQSVERAVAILKAFSPDKREIGVGEISRRVKLPKSTTFRLLSTLETCGFVAQNSESGLYRLGVELIPLANSVYFYTNLRQIARPYLQHLVDTIKETASFTILVDKSVVNLEQIEFSGGLVVRAGGASNRMPFYATSSGKAIVAFLPPRDLNPLLDGILVSLTPATITNRESLEAELAQIRQQGYATAYEELEEGLHALAAPIFDHEEKVVACLSISGPGYRLQQSRVKEIAPQLIKSADQISKEAGSARR